MPEIPATAAAVTAYPAAFEAWYNDHFGLRAPLIQGHNRVKHDLLGVSPSDDVVVGTEGWLYSAADYEREYANAPPATEAELARFTAFLEARRDLLADHGARFLFVIAPNKRSVYPEFLPLAERPLRDQSPLDQLLDYLARHSTVETLDLRPVLIAGKELGVTYLKTDTHWNARGRLLAANAIVSRLNIWFDGLDAYPIESYLPEEKVLSGDLAKMLALSGHITETAPLFYAPKRRVRAVRGPETCPGYEQKNRQLNVARRYVRWSNPEGRLRIMMLRDSFGQGLAVFLAEHFRQITLTPRNELDLALLEKERPHVVIMEWVERYLHAPDGLYATATPGP